MMTNIAPIINLINISISKGTKVKLSTITSKVIGNTEKDTSLNLLNSIFKWYAPFFRD